MFSFDARVCVSRDVAGVDTAKEELLEVVACLRDSSRYAQLNARMPPGVLLTGVPGTGKTLLGEHKACPVISTSYLVLIHLLKLINAEKSHTVLCSLEHLA